MNRRSTCRIAPLVIAALLVAGCQAEGTPDPVPGDGTSGTDGTSGVDGTDGTDGADGLTGPPGRDGTSGVDGTDGTDGAPGGDGATGPTGPAGPGGENAGDLLIVDLHADDPAGTTGDTTVVAHFAHDVTALDGRLADQALTMTYGFRDAPSFRASASTGGAVLDGPCGVTPSCFSSVGALRTLALEGDDPGTGFVERGARFHFAFDRAMAHDTRDRLDAWLTGLLGDDAVTVIERPNASYAVVAQIDLPATAFDVAGENDGFSLFLPAFTVRDAEGDGNAAATFVLHDGAADDAQAEPVGLPFDPALNNLVDTGREDGRYAVGDAFVLRFDRGMERDSTRGAIKVRLEASGVWPEVSVTTTDDVSFTVTVLSQAVDLTGRGNQHVLTLQPWDVTSADGITNTIQSISFTITDITVPRLTTVGTLSTLRVLLAGGVPVRASNDQLVEGDVLEMVFTEPMDDVPTRSAITALLNGLGIPALPDEIVRGLDGATFSFTLFAGDTLAFTATTMQLGVLSTATVQDENGVNLAANQNPTAVKNEWIVPWALVDAVATAPAAHTLRTIVEGGTREDAKLEAGDRVQVVFSKSMDPTTTSAELAAKLAAGTIAGGSRGGTWLAANVEALITISQTAAPGDTFTYTLQAGQELTITGETFSLGALATTVLDDNGLRFAVTQSLVAHKDAFDPASPPSLVSITATPAATMPCGDGALGEGDQVVFTFSEAIRFDRVDQVREEIRAKVDAAALGTALQLADVTANGAAYRVLLPAGATLDTAQARAFQLAAAPVVDANGVAAVGTTLFGTLAATDVLHVSGRIARQRIDGDGLLVGGDQLALTFDCRMDEFYTLSAVQEAVDTMAAVNGLARTESTNAQDYTITILPGRQLDVSTTRTLTLQGLFTDEGALGDLDSDATPIPGALSATFVDVRIPDATLVYQQGTAQGLTARFSAPAAVRSGTWFLSGITANLSRVDLDLAFVFSSFSAPLDAVCGDGVVEDSEGCDPPGVAGCDESCAITASCGDGDIDPREQCEPAGSGLCSASCAWTALPGTWACDPTYFQDGTCDCGCGAVDPDCDAATCSFCGDAGGCGRIDCLSDTDCPADSACFAGGCSGASSCFAIDPDNTGVCL